MSSDATTLPESSVPSSPLIVRQIVKVSKQTSSAYEIQILFFFQHMDSLLHFVYICVSMQEIPFCILYDRIVKMIKIPLFFLWL